MGLRDYLVRKLGGYTVQEHVISPGPSFRNSPRKEIASGINVGTWVIWEDRPCIAHPAPAGAGDVLELHVVDPSSGDTVMVTHQPIDRIRRAKIREIPECRRNVSKETLARLGYID